MVTRAPEDVMTEIAQLAACFHWSLGSLLDLEHGDRERFLHLVDQVGIEAGEPA